MPPLTSNFTPATSIPSQSTAVAVVSYLKSGTRTAIGATKGGAGFDPGIKMREGEWDGKKHNVATAAAGTQEVTRYAAKITATIIDHTDDVYAAALAGSTVASGVRTPILANLGITTGQMLEKVWYQIGLKDGTFRVHEFDFGLVTAWPTDTKEDDEANLKFEIMAVVDGDRSDYSSKLPDFRTFRLDADGNVIV